VTLNPTSLNDYERAELAEYPQIYYGLIRERDNLPTATDTHEYDDAHGQCLHAAHDHLAYRYEILDTLSEGNFGRVFRCRDHKTGGLSAVKVVRNQQRDHDKARVEISILEVLRNPVNCLSPSGTRIR
jgi:dual specificity tyrosine-phosphorylation-regulated kinase 2/3/4